SRVVSAQGSSTGGSTTTTTSAISATIMARTPHSTPFTLTATTSAAPRRGRSSTRGEWSRAPSGFVEGPRQGPVHLGGGGQLLLQQRHAAAQRDHIHALHARALGGAHPVAH